MTSGSKYTIEEVAEKLGVDTKTAQSFVKACMGFEICLRAGVKKRVGRGKGVYLYSFKDEAPTSLWNLVHKL